MSYHANVERVTPDRASDMLSRNYSDNRNIRESYVSQLAEVMRQGRFISENGQTLVVGDDDDILYDGQHRLQALILSGMSYNFIIAYIIDGKEKYTTIDNGTRRLAADFINLPDSNSCAAFAKIQACLEFGSAPLLSCLQGKWTAKTEIDRGMQVLYCEQYPDKVIDTVRKARRMREAVSCGTPKSYASFIGTISYLEDETTKLDLFIDEFTSIGCTNKTVNALKTTIMREFSKAKGNPSVKWTYSTLLDGFYHYCQQDGGVMLNKQQARLDAYQKKLETKRERRDKSKNTTK